MSALPSSIQFILIVTFYNLFPQNAFIVPNLISDAGINFYYNNIEFSVLGKMEFSDTLILSLEQAYVKLYDFPFSGLQFSLGRTPINSGEGEPYSIINFLSSEDFKYPGLFQIKNSDVGMVSYNCYNSSISAGMKSFEFRNFYPFLSLSTILLGIDLQTLLYHDSLPEAGISFRKDLYIVGLWGEYAFVSERHKYLAGADFGVARFRMSMQFINGEYFNRDGQHLVPGVQYLISENFRADFMLDVLEDLDFVRFSLKYRHFMTAAGWDKEKNYFVLLNYSTFL